MLLSRCARSLFYKGRYNQFRIVSFNDEYNKNKNSNKDWTTHMHQRNFRDFGHKQEVVSKVTVAYSVFIVSVIMGCAINWNGIKDIFFPTVGAANKIESKKDEEEDEEDEDLEDNKSLEEVGEEVHKKKKSKKDKVGFRSGKIVQYENRIRQFSTPDKVFRYFATLETVHPVTGTREVLMTPDDFIRSLTPSVLQPRGLGLDKYKRYDPKTMQIKMELELDKNSIFYKLGSYGLITFSDYIFLLTVLSTSRRHFEIAFRMFDANGDGDVDYEEFNRVSTLIRQQSSIGSRHRDHANTGNTFKGVNSALMTYFFGPDLKQKLKIEKFLDFQQELQQEILNLEFDRKKPDENGYITEVAFTELLLAYAGFTQKKKLQTIKRVKKHFKDSTEGIHREDYLKFFHFLSNIYDVDTALTFYHIAGASIDPDTLKHVAKTVAHVDLSEHIIKVVYVIFDENRDGQLSNREFIAVMKNRALRGLEKPKDTGFVKRVKSILICAKNMYYTA